MRRFFEQSTTADVPHIKAPGLGQEGEECVVDGQKGKIIIESGIKYCRVPKKDSDWEQEKQILRVKALLGKYKDWAKRKGYLTFLASSVLREFIQEVGLTDYEYNILSEEMGFNDSLKKDQEDKPKYEPRAGDYCTIDGKMGKLVEVSGKLQCDIGEKGKEAAAEAASFFLTSNKFQYNGKRIKRNKLKKAIDSIIFKKVEHEEILDSVLVGSIMISVNGRVGRLLGTNDYGWKIIYDFDGDIRDPGIDSKISFSTLTAAVEDLIDLWSRYKPKWGIRKL